MPLTKDDLKKIDDISAKHTEELATIVAKGFQQQQEYMDERFTKIETTQAEHSKTLYEHGELNRKTQEILKNHTERLERIEEKENAIADTVRDHQQRIDELEKAA